MNEAKRNISIDILKFLACVLITNSHMDELYVGCDYLATGGAIGDVLFFFCSGFTLFLGRNDRFDNWYKRRINRIYPSVFGLAIIASFLYGSKHNMSYIILQGGGWFVSCIMIYYVLLYFIRKYFFNHLKSVFAFSCFVVVIWYIFFFDNKEEVWMYKDTYFKWGHFFLFMLLGAIMGIKKEIDFNNPLYDFTKLIFCTILFYGIQYAGIKYPILGYGQIFSLIPLLGITFYLYKIANSPIFKQLYQNKIVNWTILCIGGLCLEVYLIQPYCRTTELNDIFPLNIIIISLYIIIMAYITRCVARFFQQTFNAKNGYEWHDIFKII